MIMGGALRGQAQATNGDKFARLRVGVASLARTNPGAADDIAKHLFSAMVRLVHPRAAISVFGRCMAAIAATRRQEEAALRTVISVSTAGYPHGEAVRTQLFMDIVFNEPQLAPAMLAAASAREMRGADRLEPAFKSLAATEPTRRALLAAGRTLDISAMLRLPCSPDADSAKLLMAQLPRCGQLLSDAEVARWSMAMTLHAYPFINAIPAHVDAAKAAFSSPTFDPSPADPARLAICHHSVELAAQPWRLATHATAVGDGIELMKSMNTAGLVTYGMRECVSLLDDTGIAPGQRLHILSHMAHLLAPKLRPSDLLYLGLKGHELFDAHVDAANAAKAEAQAQAQKAAAEARKTRGEAEAAPLEDDEPAQPTALADDWSALHTREVEDVVTTLKAFERLEDVAWIYAAKKAGGEVTVENLRPKAAQLRRLRADLRVLCGLGRPREASAPPTPQSFLFNLVHILENSLAAPIDEALGKLARYDAEERAKKEAGKNELEKGKKTAPPVVPPEVLERLFEKPAPAQPAADRK